MSETKHEMILKYIESLPVNSKVSVRLIAKEMNVSEGTAYRAIKQAENAGLVKSIPKVGTIRIETIQKRKLEDMTLNEISFITESAIISGEESCNRIPKSFCVCFSTKDAKAKQLNSSKLVISSGDSEILEYCAEQGAALLLVNGSFPDEQFLTYAKQNSVPVLLTGYDAFEIITMVNRAISERQIRQDLIRMEDVMKSNIITMSPYHTVADWNDLTLKVGHTSFPVINGENKLLGVVTPLSVTGVNSHLPISEVMETDMLTVRPDTLVSHVSRLLVWESCEIVPVVDEDDHLLGLVSRQDIIQSLQETQKQPQFGETIDNLTLSGFKLADSTQDCIDTVVLQGKITQFMMNESNQASAGAVTMLISNAATIATHKLHRVQTVLEEMYLNCFTPVLLGEDVTVEAKLINSNRYCYKGEVSILSAGELKYKATVVMRIVKK